MIKRHSPEQGPAAALRLARKALSPSPQVRKQLDATLIATGVLTPTALASTVAAHAAAQGGVAAVTVGKAGAATASAKGAVASLAPAAKGSVASALSAATMTTKGLVTATLLTAGGAGVAVSVDAVVPHLFARTPQAGEARVPNDAAHNALGPSAARGPDLHPRIERLAVADEPAPTAPKADHVRAPLSGNAPAAAERRPPLPPRGPSVGVTAPSQATSAGRAADGAIENELAAVRRVHTALAKGDGAQAQALLHQLDAVIPEGAMQPERRVCAVLAACQRGQRERALQLAARLPLSDGEFYSRRLASSCVAPLMTEQGAGNEEPRGPAAPQKKD